MENEKKTKVLIELSESVHASFKNAQEAIKKKIGATIPLAKLIAMHLERTQDDIKAEL
jgi:hypothetical protein